jgi:outer membrane beta-barrel protein
MKGLLILLAITSLSSWASEKDVYDFLWLDTDKSVYVLQKKIHQKKGKSYFQFGYTHGISTDFQDTNGYNLNIGRYFHEEFAVELQYTQYANENDNSYESIIRVNNTEPFIRKMSKSIGVMAIWSPFYGKINTFNKIYYFDIAFGLGISSLVTESNLKYVDDSSITGKFDHENQTALLAKIDFKIYFSEQYFFQAQLLNHSYMANEPQNKNTKQLKYNFDTTFGVGYVF